MSLHGIILEISERLADESDYDDVLVPQLEKLAEVLDNYEELCETIVGFSEDWTHEEIKERTTELIDAVYTLESSELISDFEDSQIIRILKGFNNE